VRGGWRFADVDGDRRAFDHDYGLDSGPRLARIELTARQDSDTLVEGSAYGLDEREFSARAATGPGLARPFGGEASYRRNLYVYDAEGDYHTLSNRRAWTKAALTAEPSGEEVGSRFRLEFERLDFDGRTVNSRIGNPNQSPLVPAQGVPVARHFLSDELRLAYEDRSDAASWSAEVGWERSKARDDLSYSRTSPVNPGFTESEVSSGRSSSEGPDATLRLVFGRARDTQAQMIMRGSQRDLRFVETATLTAFDTSGFTQSTLGVGSGDSRLASLTLRLSQPIWSEGKLALEGELQDLRNKVRFRLFETTSQGSLVTRTQSDYDLVTRVQDRALRAGIEQTLADSLDLEVGWRWLQQRLLIPDLEPLDSDYRAGTVETHGPELGAVWRPDDRYRVESQWSHAATGGRTPTETQPEVGQRLLLKVRRRLGAAKSDGHLELYGKWRRAENDVSSTERDAQSYGASLGLAPWANARLQAGAGFTHIQSRTLTSFYFAPSITPVPTLVQFRGDSLLFDLSLDTPVYEKLWSYSSIGMQRTEGSLDSVLLRIDQDLALRLSESWTVGVHGTVLHFDESRGGADDDYDARVAMVYAELRF
jgi:hypothetical protein